MPALISLKHPLLSLPASRWLLTALAFGSIFLATSLFARHLYQQQQLERQTRFSVDAALVTVEIRDRLRYHAQFLQILRAFVSSTPRLDHSRWQHFSQQQDIHTHLPELQAYGYLPAVAPEAVERFIAQARRELNQPDYRIFPSGRPLRFPVLYISPLAGTNLRGLGYDPTSDPVRREAMEHARDEAAVSMTRRLQLFSDRDSPLCPGIELYLPLYAENQPTGTVAERQQALRGYVFAAFRISDLMQTLNYIHNLDLALQIFDDQGFESQKGGQQLTLLHDTQPERPPVLKETLQEERELSFGSRTWLLRFVGASSPAWLAWQNPVSISLIAGGGLATLAAILLWILTTQGQRAQAQAQDMTRALEKSEQRFRLAAEGANDGIWYRDFCTGNTYFSERVIRLLGYTGSSIEQSDDFFLRRLHPDDIPRRRQALETHLKQRAPYDLEVRMKRADGHWQWFNIKGQATWDAQGQPLLMAGSLSDIDARKLAEIELHQHRDRLQELVEERTELLEIALKDAREAGRAKSEFLANMSHELRTPLHAMLGFASMGLGKSEGNEKIHRYFERIEQSAERLLTLVNDLLDLARLEARKMEITPSFQDVLPILQQVVSELDPLLQKKQLQVTIEQHCASTMAFADTPRFAQVLNNLLSNAIRFSPAGGCIRFIFSTTEIPRGRRNSDQGRMSALTLVVEDQGPGIPADELEVIFDKFAQSSRTRTGAGGSGLGLAICREIMAAHRGRIHAEIRAEGGARLIVSLPNADNNPPREENPP